MAQQERKKLTLAELLRLAELPYNNSGSLRFTGEDAADDDEGKTRPALCGVVVAEAACDQSEEPLCVADVAARAQRLLFGRRTELAMCLPCSGIQALVPLPPPFRRASVNVVRV
jgi:hypothetical protein